jgi:cardiolipin synthase
MASNATHAWKIFKRPEDAWVAMYKDCLHAKQSIEFEQYILENDSLGRRFMDLFIRKAAEGVKVRIICDKFGSSKLYFSPWVKKLRKVGGAFYFYNPIRVWNILTPWRWLPRTHIKTLLVDTSIAYAGGVCLAERMQGWRDTHIRVTGPVAGEIHNAFEAIHRGIPLKRRPLPLVPSRDFSYVINQPSLSRFTIYRELLRQIKQSEAYIYIATAFFVPNRSFVRRLAQARARGVEVVVLVPQESDVVLADWVSLSYMPALMKAGLKIFHYQETVLHSKTMIVDDSWATVGSTNMDVLSFFHNREANLIISDPDAIRELKNQFHEDLRTSIEFTPERWGRIPLWKKVAGYSARILKVFLSR